MAHRSAPPFSKIYDKESRDTFRKGTKQVQKCSPYHQRPQQRVRTLAQAAHLRCSPASRLSLSSEVVSLLLRPSNKAQVTRSSMSLRRTSLDLSCPQPAPHLRCSPASQLSLSAEVVAIVASVAASLAGLRTSYEQAGLLHRATMLLPCSRVFTHLA